MPAATETSTASFTTATGACNILRFATPNDWPRPAWSTAWAAKATPMTIALAESFNGLYKTELTHRRGPWKNVDHVEWATLTYVDWFNNRRIHNEIGKIPPAELEENYYRQNATAELVTSQTNESA